MSLASIILCIESIDYKNRALYVGIFAVSWELSAILFTILYQIYPSWRLAILTSVGIIILELCLLSNVTESPRFLLTNAVRYEECKKVMNIISKINGEGCFQYCLQSENTRERSPFFLKDIFGSNMNIIKLIVCSTMWFTQYYSIRSFETAPSYLTLTQANMKIAKSLLSVFSILLSIYLINNYGRKKLAFYSLISLGTTGLSISILSCFDIDESIYLSINILNTVRMIIAPGVSNLLVLYTAEQFPTYIRCTCFGIACIISRSSIITYTYIQIFFIDFLDLFSILAAASMIIFVPSIILLEETHQKELDEVNDNFHQPFLVRN